jgi:general stress protein 26
LPAGCGRGRWRRGRIDDGGIWFVTDLHSGKEQEIESEDNVGLVFIDAREKAYLSITARAQCFATTPRPR